MMIPEPLLEAAVISAGPTLALMVNGFITWRATKSAQTAAAKAQDSAVKANADAMKAQAATSVAAGQAAEAARQLIITARDNVTKMDHILETGDNTHKIVNSQRSEMIAQIETLKKQILELKESLKAQSPF